MPLSEDDLRDLNDPKLRYVPITEDQLSRAQAEIASCEACNPEADIPFDWLLRDVAHEKGYVDYVQPRAAMCPTWKAEVHEKTLVVPHGGVEVEANI